MVSNQDLDTTPAPESGRKSTRRRSSWLGRPHNPPSLKERRRAIRVWLLLSAIVILSLADLYMTLAHLRSVGMGEDNPLARFVMSYNSPLLLGAWKVACVALACLILAIARFRRSAEVACWVCCGVLTALTIRWANYSAEASAFTTEINESMVEGQQGNWVSMGPQ
jgi:hypothetical protein